MKYEYQNIHNYATIKQGTGCQSDLIQESSNTCIASQARVQGGGPRGPGPPPPRN